MTESNELTSGEKCQAAMCFAASCLWDYLGDPKKRVLPFELTPEIRARYSALFDLQQQDPSAVSTDLLAGWSELDLPVRRWWIAMWGTEDEARLTDFAAIASLDKRARWIGGALWLEASGRFKLAANGIPVPLATECFLDSLKSMSRGFCGTPLMGELGRAAQCESEVEPELKALLAFEF
jgi:hypothetical protein